MSDVNRSVETQLALLNHQVRTVIDTHEKKFAENAVTIGSAHSEISILKTSQARIDTTLTEVKRKQDASFGNVWTILSGSIAILALLRSIF